MSTRKRSLLLVGVSDEAAERLEDVLSRGSIFSDRLADPEEARELAAQLPFDVLVLSFPLAGVELFRYLSRLRHSTSISRHAAVLLLSEPDHLRDAEEYVGKGVNRVISSAEPPQVLQGAIAELLGVAPRFPLRVAMRVEVALEKGTARTLCQTENLSISGMLVRTPQALELGTELRFEISLPRQSAPIHGKAVVARRTDALREKVSGVGIQFISFEGKDGERFEAFVNEITSSQRR